MSAPTPAPLTSRFAQNDLLRPLLADFVAGLMESFVELKMTFHGGNTKELERLSHRLKGEAATYGYPDLAVAAAELENGATQGAANSAHLDAIQALISRVLAGFATEPLAVAAPAKGASLTDVVALIVDDSPPMQLLMKRMLEIAGVRRVDVADGGSAALALCGKTTYDLLLIDRQMPEATGPEVLAHLRATGVQAPAIAISAALTRTSDDGDDDGFAYQLPKPFTQVQLVEAAKAALRR